MSIFTPDYVSMPEEYASVMNVVANAMPEHFSDSNAKQLSFRKSDPDMLSVSCRGNEVIITAGTKNAFLRGVGCALAGENVSERVDFSTLGTMLDCSRNRVYHVDFIKKFLLKTALMGFNLMMLYTEDVYELPGEPAFGYMRGRYTKEEIREISAYADSLGIKITACIQTLAHLEHIFTHYQYSKILDTNGILLVDETETYQLIEKMICFWAENLNSKQIHIGMDEAHNLGRGKFLDMHGYEHPSEIFLRHLSKVCGICEKYGLSPMIWSDMLLRFPDPEKIRRALPENLKLCYWNYSSSDPETYEKDFERHRAFGQEPLMTSTVYTYNTFCWFAERSELVIPPCVDACKKSGVKELLFTIWGDAGAFCNFDSALAGLTYASSIAFGEEKDNTKLFSALFQAVCGEDYTLFREAAKLHRVFQKNIIPVPGLIWQDPLQGGIYSYCFLKYNNDMQVYVRDLENVHSLLSNKILSPSLQEMFSVIDLLLFGISFRRKLLNSYIEKDLVQLSDIITCDIPRYKEKVTTFDLLFREEWMSSAKPFGLEIIQRRNAGLMARLDETARRIQELMNGRLNKIEELEESLSAAKTPDFIPAPPVFSGCLESY